VGDIIVDAATDAGASRSTRCRRTVQSNLLHSATSPTSPQSAADVTSSRRDAAAQCRLFTALRIGLFCHRQSWGRAISCRCAVKKHAQRLIRSVSTLRRTPTSPSSARVRDERGTLHCTGAVDERRSFTPNTTAGNP